MKNKLLKWAYLFGFAALMGCQTYQSKTESTFQQIKSGEVQSALPELKILADKKSDDQLIYLLDYATALQIAGDYKTSADYFAKADALVEAMDYQSVSNIALSAIGGEEAIQYKGESFEKFLLNSINSLNYLALSDRDGALVEVRKINERISKMKMDGRDPYELSPFATLLSAHLWEAAGQYDDAYIAFEKTYKLDPNIPNLLKDLIRTSMKARRPEARAKWKALDESTDAKELDEKRNDSKLLVVVAYGWSPRKHPDPGQHRFPILRSSSFLTKGIRISSESLAPQQLISSYSVEQVALETFRKDSGALLARRLAALAAKAVVAKQVSDKNQLLGDVAWLVMNISDRADLRQWGTLPAEIIIYRTKLSPGQHKIRIEGLDSSMSPTGEFIERDITVNPGETKIEFWRALK